MIGKKSCNFYFEIKKNIIYYWISALEIASIRSRGRLRAQVSFMLANGTTGWSSSLWLSKPENSNRKRSEARNSIYMYHQNNNFGKLFWSKNFHHCPVKFCFTSKKKLKKSTSLKLNQLKCISTIQSRLKHF